MMLARLHRAGELTPVYVPAQVKNEAMRDLCRAGRAKEPKQGASTIKCVLLRNGFRYTA